MKILLNENQEIVAYAGFGDLSGSIEYTGSVPDGFKSNFKPSYYLYQGSKIIVNPNYEEPSIEIPTPEPPEPSKEWQAINMLALQIAQLKAERGGA